MKYRNLGKSGLKVSEISLGSWLTYGTAVEQETANACIARAFELGINFFDTSNAYNNGEGERALGSALKQFKRSDYVLSTKVFFPMGEGANDRGLSRKPSNLCGEAEPVFVYRSASSISLRSAEGFDMSLFFRFCRQTPFQ